MEGVRRRRDVGGLVCEERFGLGLVKERRVVKKEGKGEEEEEEEE